MSALSKRLKSIAASSGITVREFERRIGVSNGYVSRIGSEIGANKLESILREFPYVDRNWLLTGEGTMAISGGRAANVAQNSGRIDRGDRGNTTTTNNYYGGCPELGDNEQAEITEIETCGRPYYDVDFVGGFDLVLNDQTITPTYNIDFAPYNKDGVIWCNITGRSMEPEIGSGDIIALKEVHDWQQYINYGEIYAIVTGNDLRTVKRVRKGGSSDSVLLVPTNPNYDIQEIEKSVISRIFSVLGCLKRF